MTAIVTSHNFRHCSLISTWLSSFKVLSLLNAAIFNRFFICFSPILWKIDIMWSGDSVESVIKLNEHYYLGISILTSNYSYKCIHRRLRPLVRPTGAQARKRRRSSCDCSTVSSWQRISASPPHPYRISSTCILSTFPNSLDEMSPVCVWKLKQNITYIDFEISLYS